MKELNPSEEDCDELNYLLYDFAMNYSLESLQMGYTKELSNANKVDEDILRKLGYTEEDIYKSK